MMIAASDRTDQVQAKKNDIKTKFKTCKIKTRKNTINKLYFWYLDYNDYFFVNAEYFEILL